MTFRLSCRAGPQTARGTAPGARNLMVAALGLSAFASSCRPLTVIFDSQRLSVTLAIELPVFGRTSGTVISNRRRTAWIRRRDWKRLYSQTLLHSSRFRSRSDERQSPRSPRLVRNARSRQKPRDRCGATTNFVSSASEESLDGSSQALSPSLFLFFPQSK